MTDQAHQLVHLLREITEDRSRVACGAPASKLGRPYRLWVSEVTCEACLAATEWGPALERKFRRPGGTKRPKVVVEPTVEHGEDTADVDELPEPTIVDEPPESTPSRPAWRAEDAPWLDGIVVSRPTLGTVTIAGRAGCEHCGEAWSDRQLDPFATECPCICHAAARVMRPEWDAVAVKKSRKN